MKKIYVALVTTSLLSLVACNKNALIIEPRSALGKEAFTTNTDYPDFITASRNLDLPYLNRTATNEDQRRYANVLQLLMKRQSDSAEILLLDIFNSSADTLIRNESKLLLETVYLADSKWANLLRIHPNPEHRTDIYFSHAKAWSSHAPTEYRFPENGITVPLTFTRNGQPLVPVAMNGKSYWFIIDTGGQFSAISKRVADACGVRPIQVQGTDAKSMFSNPGLISKIAIGKAEIQNLPVMIIESKDMDVRLFGLFTLMKIDGIIGWPQLKNLRLDFNSIQGTLNLSKGRQTKMEDGNFFFYLRPLVKATATNGASLFFWLDSGKGHTSLFPRGVAKANSLATQKGIAIGSMTTPMGGTAIQRRGVIRDFNVAIKNNLVKFSDIEVERVDNPFFDGWMGMDIGKSNRLVIDYSAGELDIQNP